MNLFDEVKTGLNEAIECEKGNLKAKTHTLSVESVGIYTLSNKKSAKIKAITLLSKEKYQRYKSIIPPVNNSWWILNSSGKLNSALLVNTDGDIVTNCIVDAEFIGVRPLLLMTLSPNEKINKNIGSKIKYAKHIWTILGIDNNMLYILCDDIVAKRCFDKKEDLWYNSNLRRWLLSEGKKVVS